jgi:hypothetical protein
MIKRSVIVLIVVFFTLANNARVDEKNASKFARLNGDGRVDAVKAAPAQFNYDIAERVTKVVDGEVSISILSRDSFHGGFRPEHSGTTFDAQKSELPKRRPMLKP